MGLTLKVFVAPLLPLQAIRTNQNLCSTLHRKQMRGWRAKMIAGRITIKQE